MAKETKKDDIVINIGGEIPKEKDIKEEIISKDLAKKLENIKNDEEGKPVEIEIQGKKEEPRVKIKTKKNHRCFIGGTWYSFLEGKVTTVPQNVKNVLMKTDILAPLD